MICFLVTIRTNVPPHLSLALLPCAHSKKEMRTNRWLPSLGIGGGVPCKSCGSVNQRKFAGEMAIHFLGLRNIDKPDVWVFPEIVVCLDCGTAEFAVPEAELRRLAEGDAAAAG
jgi:hypothetical protein